MYNTIHMHVDHLCYITSLRDKDTLTRNREGGGSRRVAVKISHLQKTIKKKTFRQFAPPLAQLSRIIGSSPSLRSVTARGKIYPNAVVSIIHRRAFAELRLIYFSPLFIPPVLYMPGSLRSCRRRYRSSGKLPVAPRLSLFGYL